MTDPDTKVWKFPGIIVGRTTMRPAPDIYPLSKIWPDEECWVSITIGCVDWLALGVTVARLRCGIYLPESIYGDVRVSKREVKMARWRFLRRRFKSGWRGARWSVNTGFIV
jgi:hypothetical protein